MHAAVDESVGIRKCRGIRKRKRGGGGEGGGFLAIKDRPLSEGAPNPSITPLHVGHSADKPNNSDERTRPE